MDRRNFLKVAAMTGLAVAAPRSARALTPYAGPFYVMISARGGWDPTYLCDPKP
ncbi:MAG: twin-arginine translocation signal domain-containing protein, partial [Myxococcales bacterium]|nr:twin-arginine translocation signal domain-containing protein [Myxococcales bacterium]